MQQWNPNFNPSTTSISTVPEWVGLPNLPLHLWNDPYLHAIGDVIGQFHSICPNTTKFFRTTYARICVQMDLSKGLPGELKIVNQDYSWTQALDYENIYFRCRSCYNIGHLAKACPNISQPYKHNKATWWTGARPEHYTVTNIEPGKYDGTDELQLQSRLPRTHISLNKLRKPLPKT